MTDKKKFTPTVETVKEDSLTKAEWEAVNKAKGVERLNQVLRGFGLVAIVLFYLMAVEFLFETSLLGLIFTPKEFHAFWYFVCNTGKIANAITDTTEVGASLVETQAWVTGLSSGAQILDDWLGWGIWFPVAFISAIEVMATIGVAYIVAYSVRDIVGIVKNLIKSAKGTVLELSSTVTNNIEEELKTDDAKPVKKKKTKKEKEEDFNKELNTVVAATTVPSAPTKLEALDEETLDELLKEPHTPEEQKILDSAFNTESPRNRLFDK